MITNFHTMQTLVDQHISELRAEAAERRIHRIGVPRRRRTR
jgi:hypothetical protein